MKKREPLKSLINEMPTDKGQLSVELMSDYVANDTSVSMEDMAWFIDLLDDNSCEKKNNITSGEEVAYYQSYKLDVVREKFCQHFTRFYKLSDKAKYEERRAKEKAPHLANLEKRRQAKATLLAKTETETPDNVVGFRKAM